MERETTHREKEPYGDRRKKGRVGNEDKSRGKERGGRRERGQVEVERQEARIRAERLDTSQHGKEET